MDRIALLRPALAELEIAILQIDEKDHNSLHADAKKWVNDNKVFPKPVQSVEMLPHPTTQAEKAGARTETTRIIMMVHYPPCAVVSSCVQA